MSKQPKIIYKIIYRYANQTNDSKPYTEHVLLPNIKALAKYLNAFAKRGNKIVIVWLSNEKFDFVRLVQFIQVEIDTQKFIVGKKQRLLAWAKYKCGYNLSIDV